MPGSTDQPAGEPDALAPLREEVDAAYAAADALVREAEVAARAAAEGVPERGWDAGHPPGAPEGGAVPGATELRALLGLVEVVRGAVPPELARQLADAARELLLALRALVDFYLARLPAPADPPPEPPPAGADPRPPAS